MRVSLGKGVTVPRRIKYLMRVEASLMRGWTRKTVAHSEKKLPLLILTRALISPGWKGGMLCNWQETNVVLTNKIMEHEPLVNSTVRGPAGKLAAGMFTKVGREETPLYSATTGLKTGTATTVAIATPGTKLVVTPLMVIAVTCKEPRAGATVRSQTKELDEGTDETTQDPVFKVMAVATPVTKLPPAMVRESNEPWKQPN